MKAPDLPVYQDILEILKGRAQVLVASERRRLLSTGDLSEECLREITAKGAEVTPDFQYDLEANI